MLDPDFALHTNFTRDVPYLCCTHSLECIFIGERFQSFESFRSTLAKYEKEQFANYPIYNSVRDHQNTDLKYKWVRLKCKLGGDHVKVTNERQTSSYKQGCGSFIYVAQRSQDGVSLLQIIANSEEHNHSRSENLFKHIVNQRKAVFQQKREYLENTVAIKPNLRALQKQVTDGSDGVVYLKDLHNCRDSMKESLHQNDLVMLVNEMMQIENATVKVFYDNNDELDCIYFQDERMQMYFDRFPELVMFDGTYKLNDRRMPLVIMLVVDGNGESQIAGLCIVRSENVRTFRHFFDAFKNENPRYKDIEVILSDKSFANRIVFKSSFPDAHHQLCVFHVLQIMSREITSKKRRLTGQQREEALRIVKRMVYAKSQADYDESYRQLVGSNSAELTNYFNECWHDIQDQ